MNEYVIKSGSFSLLALLFLPAWSQAATVGNHDFNDGTFGPYSNQSEWAIQSSGGVGNSKAARMVVNSSGTAGKAIGLIVSNSASNSWWIEFDVKVVGTPVGGSKFVKLFGDITASRNNMTFGLNPDLSTPKNESVGYYGDTLCISKWAGPPNAGSCSAPTWITTGSSINVTGGVWHHYKLYVKRADAGSKNGEVKVWFNGNLNAHIINMDSFAMNFGDPTPGFYKIEIGGYVREYRETTGYGFLTGTTTPWEFWVDNLYVGTTEKNAALVAGPTLSNPQPTSALAAGTTSTTMSVTTSEASTCKYSTTPGIAYATMTNTMNGSGTTSHTKTLAGLTNGSSTVYYIRCAKTSNGEATTTDFPITVSVLSNQFSLSTTKNGTGSGTLTSSPSGISCGTTCNNNFNENSTVTLTATPDSNSTFTSWTGCTSITGNQCTVNLSSNKSIIATFTSNTAICDSTHYWICTDGPCQVNGFYYWENACRTIAQPSDWTGTNVATNGTFSAWTSTLPDSWLSYTPTKVAQDTGACGLYADASSSAQIYRSLPEIKTYRYAINVRNMINKLEIWTEAEDSVFHNSTDGASRTVTGLVSYPGEGDHNMYIQVPGGSVNNAIVDEIVLKEVPISTNLRFDVDNNSTTNTTDALLTLRNSLGMDMSSTAWQTNTTTGDADCSGTCNTTDALLILRYSLGMEMEGTSWCG